jgi:hypothetical protein
MSGLALYPLICVAIFYLGSQALIMEWLWSRYPPRLDAFMSCPACTGFWLGLGCGALGWWLQIPFLSLDSRHFATPILIGLCSITWTPLLANLHTRAMTYAHAMPESVEGDNVLQLKRD